MGAPGAERPAFDARTFEMQTHERRRRAIAMVGTSYGIDSALLAGYCTLGLLPWWVLAAYIAAAFAQCFGFDRAIASGWSKRFEDPSLAKAQMAFGSLVQVAFIAIAPQAFTVFAFATFTLVAFGTLQLSIRANMVVWSLIALSVVTAFIIENERFLVPTDTIAQRALLVASWALALLRCSFIGSFGLALRALVERRQRQLEADAKHLSEMAQRDPLTGALNRRGITTVLEATRDAAVRNGRSFAIALLDLDHFKAVNDRHGHQAGDDVLQMAARGIASALRTGDAMGRYGGEEFLVVLPEVSDTAAVQGAAERVRRAVAEQPWSQLMPGLAQTVSIGVAVHRDGDTVEATIARADAAMYAAKTGGRNAVCLG